MEREVKLVVAVLAIVAILFLVNSCKKVEFKQKGSGDNSKTTLEVKTETE